MTTTGHRRCLQRELAGGVVRTGKLEAQRRASQPEVPVRALGGGGRRDGSRVLCLWRERVGLRRRQVLRRHRGSSRPPAQGIRDRDVRPRDRLACGARPAVPHGRHPRGQARLHPLSDEARIRADHALPGVPPEPADIRLLEVRRRRGARAGEWDRDRQRARPAGARPGLEAALVRTRGRVLDGRAAARAADEGQLRAVRVPVRLTELQRERSLHSHRRRQVRGPDRLLDRRPSRSTSSIPD